VGLDPSYVARIVSGRQRPAVEVLMALYAHLGLETSQAARLYAADVQHGFNLSNAHFKQVKERLKDEPAGALGAQILFGCL
jgi:transcriptional regulator with XRE-family HTH domain